MNSISNIFSEEEIDYIMSLPEVKLAKDSIDKQSNGQITFSINLESHLKSYLHEKTGLDLQNINSIPMRWIKGDTKPHIDRGTTNFDKTYLVYLTDSQGEFIIDNNSYPITKGHGYVFSEGLYHETIHTGVEPRLLMGPMSEHGFAVGGGVIYGDGATDTIYIRYESDNLEYQINDDGWNTLSLSVTIENTNPDPSLNLLKIIFTTDITLTGVDSYFICGSDGIQFGSTSLNMDGSRPKITIQDVENYGGLIRNSTNRNDIYIFNLEVLSGGSTNLNEAAGWIGRKFFGQSARNNYIVNCFSNGNIPENGGGIVGAYAGQATDGPSSLYIIGCSSQGSIGTAGGGIVGYYAGADEGYVKCEQCWSTGLINLNAGGIFGSYASSSDSSSGGTTIALNCYSTGTVNGQDAGGIFGLSAGSTIDSLVTAENCYSQGSINGTDAGGIYGAAAGIGLNASVTANNCYSSGIVTISGNGIFSGGPDTNRIQTNCYVADNDWSDADANAALVGFPTPPNTGSKWINRQPNSPYELRIMGYTPYNIQNIVLVLNNIEGEKAYFQKSYTQTIYAGQQTIPAILENKSYEIIGFNQLNPSFGTITIDENTGVISTTTATVPGTYIIYVYNTGSYNVTSFDLVILGNENSSESTVNIPPCCQPVCPEFNQTTNNTQQQLAVKQSAIAIASNVDSTYLAINQNRSVNLAQPAFNSYRDYMLYLQSKYR